MRVVAAVEPADFRRGIDGLAHCVQGGAETRSVQRMGICVSQSVGDGDEDIWCMTAKVFAFSTSGFPAASSAGGHAEHDPASTKTLAAHQLHVLLSGGNPDATQAAPVWRAVG